MNISRLAAAAVAAVLVSGLAAYAASSISLDGNLILNGGTATASSGAATLNNKEGIITSETLTTLPGSTYTLTLTNSIATTNTDLVLWSVERGTITNGNIVMTHVAPTVGSIVFIISNGLPSTTAATGTPDPAKTWNGTLRVKYLILKHGG